MIVHEQPGPVERSSQAWREGLLALSSGCAEAWCLVVPDMSKPAFMQPPIPEGDASVLKKVHYFPDEVDIVSVSRSHAVKSARMRNPRPAHWAVALVTLQTSANYGCPGSHGVARMNKGSGNRPGLTAGRLPDSWARFHRDLRLLLEVRADVVDDHGFSRRGGRRLVWLEPWDGEKALSIASLDPFFVEVCRRVRLVRIGSSVVLRAVGTKTQRIAGKELQGNIGDVWTPIRKKDGAALTGSRPPLSYRKLHGILLSGEWLRNPALEVRTEDGDAPMLLGQVLLLGNCKPDGYYERVVPIPSAVRPLFGKPDGVQRIGHRSETWLSIVDAVQKKLRWAIQALLGNAASAGSLRGFVASHDAMVDREYFQRLFASMSMPAEQADQNFAKFCVEAARRELGRAIDRLPLPSARRYRVIAEAESRLEGGMWREDRLRPFLQTMTEKGPAA